MSLSNFEKIVEFHYCSGLLVTDSDTRSVYSQDSKLVKLRLDLIVEEFNELLEAVKYNNFVEIIDALADLLYVSYGACASFGFLQQKGHVFNICDTNIQNKPDRLITTNNPNLVILYQSILATNIDKIIELVQHVLSVNIPFNNLSDVMMMTAITNSKNLKLELLNLIKNIYITSIAFGVDINRAYALVHESNMTKFCNTEQEAIDSVKTYETDERYDTPAYKKSNGKYVIYNQSSGKILKSKYYKPVSFDSILMDVPSLKPSPNCGSA